MSVQYVDDKARIEAVREYLRDGKNAVQSSDPPKRHREALDGVWKECLRQADDQNSPALNYCSQAVRSGRGDAETREQYESRLNGIPSKAFAPDENPGSVYEGVDKPQHFFTAASISYRESSVNGGAIGEATAKGLGRAYEVKDAVRQGLGENSGGYDVGDIHADDKGAEFGAALAASTKPEDRPEVSRYLGGPPSPEQPRTEHPGGQSADPASKNGSADENTNPIVQPVPEESLPGPVLPAPRSEQVRSRAEAEPNATEVLYCPADDAPLHSDTASGRIDVSGADTSPESSRLSGANQQPGDSGFCPAISSAVDPPVCVAPMATSAAESRETHLAQSSASTPPSHIAGRENTALRSEDHKTEMSPYTPSALQAESESICTTTTLFSEAPQRGDHEQCDAAPQEGARIARDDDAILRDQWVPPSQEKADDICPVDNTSTPEPKSASETNAAQEVHSTIDPNMQ